MQVLERLFPVYATILVLLVIQTILAEKRIPRPHGVSFLKASLYYPNDNGNLWTCLDGTKTIKYVQINDDYCDCADGSDEPGTSACVMGKFHCANKGHRAENILSSRVKDGICDCCDGSDEFVEGQDNKCVNTCLEFGRIEQEEQRSRIELHKRGTARRSEMISRGKQLRAERDTRHAELEQQRQQQDSIKLEKENIKKQAEGIESEAIEVWKEQNRERQAEGKPQEELLTNIEEAQLTFGHYDTNKDGFVELTELQVDMTFDRDHNGVVTVEEAKYFLDERDRLDMDGYIDLAWPRIKSQQMLAQGVFKAPVKPVVSEDHKEEPHLEGTEEHHELEESHSDPETTDDHDGAEEELADEEEEEGYDEEDGDADVGVGSVAEATTNPEYDPETQRLVEEANAARSAFNEAERALRDIEQEMKDIEETNRKDYGPNEEYAVLDGQCYNFEDREYVYSLCPFDRAAQKPRNGGSETTLGRWDSWLNGEGIAKYSIQKYTHGSGCWNGPQRSLNVQLRCGMEERIISVSEPNRCEYFYEFETPAACHDIVENTGPTHEEL